MPTYGLYLSTLVHEFIGIYVRKLSKYLKENSKGVLGTEAIKWNFTKFLVDKNGKVVKRYAPSTKPSDIEKDILDLL